MKDMILYHGSRGGITGPIQPKSRMKCDFGCGFYMGENPQQVKGLISEDKKPIFYKMKLRLSEIPEDRILILSNEQWLNVLLSCRKKVPSYLKLNIAKETLQMIKKYDVIIGAIGDDRMNEAMQAYADGTLTDAGLFSCLQSVTYGNQVVAKTKFACEKIEILSEQELNISEIVKVQEYSRRKRAESRTVVNEAIKTYRRTGLFIDELIAREKRPTSYLPIS